MAFDENLAARIRTTLARKKGIEEKKMFGSSVFFLHGNILVGVWKNSLIVRLGEEQAEDALLEPHVKPFDVTGKAMKGWAMVKLEGLQGDSELKEWVKRCLTFVGKLPAN
jgi:TfoX/Sxy family transcriptional regulator of competence genes